MRQFLLASLRRFPCVKNVLRKVRHFVAPSASVSSCYVALRDGEAGAEALRLRGAWQDDALPQRQRELVEKQLRQYRAGDGVDVFDVLVQALRELPDIRPGMTVLEIGCSSGFYSEVLDIAGLPLRYSGCDYSSAFIKLACERYSSLEFAVGDATSLQYPSQFFDIVISGCCLLHIPEYALAVAETSRVATKYAIFHRTPVVWGQPERWYRKQAYGVETVEIHFNEPAFITLLNQHNLELVATYTLHEELAYLDPGMGNAVRTYVCRKRQL